MTDQRKKWTFWLVMCVALMALTVTPGKGAENKASQAKTDSVKLTFIEDGKLSKAEVEQALALARECGLTNAAEVETCYLDPGLGREIRVKSGERKSGRNSAYDTVEIVRSGWGGAKPPKGAKRLGKFSATALYTTTMRCGLPSG